MPKIEELVNYCRMTEEERFRVLQAVERLTKGNPDVIRQLEKLADLKDRKPAMYNAGLKFLKL